MTKERRRRLAAILMADVVGFSKMMERDEEGTTSLILEFHAHVRETVEQHGGRVVGTAGDSVFGDFDSIVEALDCATEIQRHLHAENAAIPQEERIEARIGLHLGDVLVEEYNVFGDGVNIAARLEQLADPGGIVLSEAVYQQVKARSDLPFEEMGTRTLKNIDQFRRRPGRASTCQVGAIRGPKQSRSGDP
jgi:adenylate cyclase